LNDFRKIILVQVFRDTVERFWKDNTGSGVQRYRCTILEGYCWSGRFGIPLNDFGKIIPVRGVENDR
jgi:hypothetical protein